MLTAVTTGRTKRGMPPGHRSGPSPAGRLLSR